MSSRTYLSIGDVLGLLRQEFPDVTISKIRFLESQGLVNPERTPSGYRKFYEPDVERLRWVLRQQREHFLPLKVIKGRLEQDDPDDVDGATLDQVAEEDVVHAVPVPAERSARVLATRGASARHEAGSGHDTTPRTTAGSAAGAAGRVTTPTAGREPAGRELARRQAAGREAVGHEPARREAVGVATRVPPAAHAPAPMASAASAAREAASPPGRAPAAAPRVAGAPPGPRADPAPVPGADALGMETLSGDAMTTEELASAAGLDAAAVAELDSYGLVSGRVVGGVTYYERDALDVARLAAGFARYGVEARHLRLHKHAAEREAGFIEQIVLPVLKQRNPEARRRALDTVEELSRLGLGLREALLRSTLRDQLGG